MLIQSAEMHLRKALTVVGDRMFVPLRGEGLAGGLGGTNAMCIEPVKNKINLNLVTGCEWGRIEWRRRVKRLRAGSQIMCWCWKGTKSIHT